ncbi:hypothetical protein HMPREF9418_2713 [Neisseria macacae ATCC 33926]|uniref:Uncharacterized protein n=1 Tax=Neisseria macacae ATCC 33926 TaxID=997348 RepID=A0AA36UHE9_9NEIS|nr:hypothetical protein HMPREF9418_2713 [Neisseria macacae ATCC 33926]
MWHVSAFIDSQITPPPHHSICLYTYPKHRQNSKIPLLSQSET